MLRTRTPVRTLGPADRDAALELCSRDIVRNVFVAARILEGAGGGISSTLGHHLDGALTSICWTSANLVPVETTEVGRAAYADRVRRWRGRCGSILGPRDQVLDLWSLLEADWGPPRAIRAHQPLLVTTTPPSVLGVPLDPRVRPAGPREVDLVVPAAAHMFTAEIGYPPYRGSDRSYRATVGGLISRGHTFVVIERGEVLFKADIGSVALGCAQLQGVWLHPRLRGQGLAAPMLASVLEQVMIGPAPIVCLYVNDFNLSARAAYERVGLRGVGEFATVIL